MKFLDNFYIYRLRNVTKRNKIEEVALQRRRLSFAVFTTKPFTHLHVIRRSAQQTLARLTILVTVQPLPSGLTQIVIPLRLRLRIKILAARTTENDTDKQKQNEKNLHHVSLSPGEGSYKVVQIRKTSQNHRQIGAFKTYGT